ncbi:penicillin-binding protein [Spirochaetia bacterium]|nr:penicillin-binding protein [Spirochaetia bacterium]
MDLSSYIEAINRQKLKVEGIIVMQHGKKIAEHRWIPEVPRIVYSLSKSFTSTAVGMVIDDGKLSLNDRVIDVLAGVISNPADSVQAARLKSLTLRHLLTMSRGHDTQGPHKTVAETLAQPLTRDPGTYFFYDNGCTFLASAMVTKVTGLKVRDFLLDRLLRPLGISDPQWDESEDGVTHGYSGLRISTGDIAKFAQFLLQKGNWNGKQLVSAAWIEEASRKQIETTDTQTLDDWNLGYGYQFWRCRHGIYRGDGAFGQYAVVIQNKDAVVAVNSDEKEGDRFRQPLYEVWNHILPQL